MNRRLVGIALLALCGGLSVPAAAPSAAQSVGPELRGVEHGRGTIGEWVLVWRYDGFGEMENHFRALIGDEREFPLRTSVVGAIDRELVFFDADGNIDEKVPLARDEEVLPSADGNAYLVWSQHPTSRLLKMYRYHERGSEMPRWEATAAGEPLLLSPDGSLFVIAVADTGHDGYQRTVMKPGGSVQVVDADSNVLGGLPIRPDYVRLTGDGQRIVLLHSHELVALRADGRLDWNVSLPVDALLQREGISQLETGGGVIVVTGTGEKRPSDVLRPRREGTIHVFTDSGKLLWRERQDKDAPLWFQMSCVLSPDGGTLATFHMEQRELVVQAWDVGVGELLWRRAVPRSAGGRRLSVAPNGQLIVLAWGDLRTTVLAWDREGTIVWEGMLPVAAKGPHIEADGLLVTDRWIVKLVPHWEQ